MSPPNADDFVHQLPSSVMPASLWNSDIFDIAPELNILSQASSSETTPATPSTDDAISDTLSPVPRAIFQQSSQYCLTPSPTPPLILAHPPFTQPTLHIGKRWYQPRSLRAGDVKTPTAGSDTTVPYMSLGATRSATETGTTRKHAPTPTMGQELPANVLNGSHPNPNFFVVASRPIITFDALLQPSRSFSMSISPDGSAMQQKQTVTPSLDKADNVKVKVLRGKRGPYKKRNKELPKVIRKTRGPYKKRDKSSPVANAGQQAVDSVASAPSEQHSTVLHENGFWGARMDDPQDAGDWSQVTEYHQQKELRIGDQYIQGSMRAPAFADHDLQLTLAMPTGSIDPALDSREHDTSTISASPYLSQTASSEVVESSDDKWAYISPCNTDATNLGSR